MVPTNLRQLGVAASTHVQAAPHIGYGLSSRRSVLVQANNPKVAPTEQKPAVHTEVPIKATGNNVVPMPSRKMDVPVTRKSMDQAPPDNDVQRLYAKWETLRKEEAPATPATIQPRRVPSPEHLTIWQTADAVCFDVDCTITINDGLDLLAEFMGVGPQIEAITNQAMDGTLGLEEALDQRLKIINCTPSDVRKFVMTHPVQSRLTPGIETLIKTLLARGVHVYLISGGFREWLVPIAKHLGIPQQNVFANRMNWHWCDTSGEPTKLVGFDMSEPTARNQGKPEAIARIRDQFPYNNVVMVGDGITDLEAVQGTQGADLFIGYGGVVERPAVMEGADWFVNSFDELTTALKQHKVAMVGSGAFACAAMHMISNNVGNADPSSSFAKDIKMWVQEDKFEGKSLSDVINERRENPACLPGVSIGDNVTATADLVDAVSDADIIVFCAPPEHMHNICKKLAGKVKKSAIAISLTKGTRIREDGPQLISQMVTKSLGIDCSVLMGANIAKDIGKEQLSEAVIGYFNRANAQLLQKLFDCRYFNVTLIPDAVGAEMCGTLKSIVALASGVVDGLGLGNNSKSAILRQGLYEMRKLSMALYPSVRQETFLESCGIADLVSACYGGRNRLVGMEWTKAQLAGQPKSFDDLEKELLQGQKLQGVRTSNEVQEILVSRSWEQEYPLFTTLNRVINNQLDPQMVVYFKEAVAASKSTDAAVRWNGD